jgi:hypothetical protein
VKFLREKEGLPVKYVSLHNEGEDWCRWNHAGLTEWKGHDYNLYWPPEQVAEFIKLVADELKAAGLADVGATPGETSNWYRFDTWGYADAIADDGEALRKMGIITSHGFYNGAYGRWFGEHKSAGIDKLRAKCPDLHAWVTSTSWSKMDASNIKEHHGNIYTAKVNGIIPWAGIQRPAKWVGGDPNPGSAFTVHEDGSWEVRRGYFMYKQVTRAGQPGMAVARTMAMDSEIAVIGFAANGTKNPDAFVLVNLGKTKQVQVTVKGSSAKLFAAFRTTEDEQDRYAAIGDFPLQDGAVLYEAPGGSVTTFFAKPAADRAAGSETDVLTTMNENAIAQIEKLLRYLEAEELYLQACKLGLRQPNIRFILSARRDTAIESDLVNCQLAGEPFCRNLVCGSDAPYGRMTWNFGGFRCMFESLQNGVAHTDPRVRANPNLFTAQIAQNYLGRNFADFIVAAGRHPLDVQKAILQSALPAGGQL